MNPLRRAFIDLSLFRCGQAFHKSGRTDRSFDIIPFVINVPAVEVPAWVRDDELYEAVSEAVYDAVTKLAARRVTPGQLLARKNVPAEMRSKAARAMLAMRGGRATAQKMRGLGYPNLVRAREALKRKAAERRALKAGL